MRKKILLSLAAPVAASVFQEFFAPNRRFVFHAGSDQSR